MNNITIWSFNFKNGKYKKSWKEKYMCMSFCFILTYFKTDVWKEDSLCEQRFIFEILSQTKVCAIYVQSVWRCIDICHNHYSKYPIFNILKRKDEFIKQSQVILMASPCRILTGLSSKSRLNDNALVILLLYVRTQSTSYLQDKEIRRCLHVNPRF